MNFELRVPDMSYRVGAFESLRILSFKSEDKKENFLLILNQTVKFASSFQPDRFKL